MRPRRIAAEYMPRWRSRTWRVSASMRPRRIAAEYDAEAARRIAEMFRFNEAAANRRGIPCPSATSSCNRALQ